MKALHQKIQKLLAETNKKIYRLEVKLVNEREFKSQLLKAKLEIEKQRE